MSNQIDRQEALRRRIAGGAFESHVIDYYRSRRRVLVLVRGNRSMAQALLEVAAAEPRLERRAS